MIDLDIRYPGQLDVLPLTTTVSINIGENINALRSAILNIESVLGSNVNIGLFTPDPKTATVADRLNRLERGIAERNLVYQQINVADALSVLLTPANKPHVRIGSGILDRTAGVDILGSLTIFAPEIANPLTLIMTPIKIDTTALSTGVLPSLGQNKIVGKSTVNSSLLRITDNTQEEKSLALEIEGNVKITGTLIAEYSIDHTKLFNIETVPTTTTRGSTRHVTQGDYHTHRKGRYDSTNAKWIVDSSANTADTGIIQHKDLEGINTLPTQGNDFVPLPNVAYHVTGGDLHSHKTGDGAQIDHNDLKNTNPKFSNHVTGGDAHDHSNGQGAQINHSNLSNITTSGSGALHVTGGDAHTHSSTLGDGGTIDHANLGNIATTGADALHVTGGDAHAHTSDGDGGTIDHTNLSNIGSLSHAEIDARIATFRAIKTGTTSFTASGTGFSEVTVTHNLGTDQFNVAFSLSTSAPPSNPYDIGTIYVSDKTSSTFTLKRLFTTSSTLRTYDSGVKAANVIAPTGTATIAHSLGMIPINIILMHFIQESSTWEFFDPSSYIIADATNLYVSSFNLLSSDDVRIVAIGTQTTTTAQPGPAVKASRTTVTGQANNNLQFVAKTAGSAGNNITITYEISNDIQTTVAIVATSSSILVMIKGTATANDIRLGILADATAKSIVDVYTSGDGTGTISAASFTAMATNMTLVDLGTTQRVTFALVKGSDTSDPSSLTLDWIAVRNN